MSLYMGCLWFGTEVLTCTIEMILVSTVLMCICAWMAYVPRYVEQHLWVYSWNVVNVYLISCMDILCIPAASCSHTSVCLNAFRFLAVQPRTTKDVELLSSVLQFLTTLLRVTVKVHSSSQSSLLDTTQLVWLVNITCHEDAVCVQLVHSYLSGKQRSVQQRQLVIQSDKIKGQLSVYFSILPSIPIACRPNKPPVQNSL